MAGRISPRLIDLIGALATGTVGAFALVRRDISDTLPGVAIAISLVPPLAVVGLLLGVGRYADAAQALLLFGTNVAAIVLTGTLLLRFYRVRDAAVAAGRQATDFGRKTLAIVVALVILVAIPLGIGSLNVALDQLTATKARPVASAWAAKSGWQVATVEVVNRTIVVTALGPPPEVKVGRPARGAQRRRVVGQRPVDPPRRRRHPLLRTRRHHLHRPHRPHPLTRPRVITTT